MICSYKCVYATPWGQLHPRQAHIALGQGCYTRAGLVLRISYSCCSLGNGCCPRVTKTHQVVSGIYRACIGGLVGDIYPAMSIHSWVEYVVFISIAALVAFRKAGLSVNDFISKTKTQQRQAAGRFSDSMPFRSRNYF